MTDWPAALHRLVAAHGESAVWQAGLETLGYPPTWTTAGSEVATLEAALNNARNRTETTTQHLT